MFVAILQFDVFPAVNLLLEVARIFVVNLVLVIASDPIELRRSILPRVLNITKVLTPLDSLRAVALKKPLHIVCTLKQSVTLLFSEIYLVFGVTVPKILPGPSLRVVSYILAVPTALLHT